MRKAIFGGCLLGVAVLLFVGTKAQSQTLTRTAYDTSSRTDVKKFSVLTKLETDFAKTLPGFADNRARITLTDSGNSVSPKELQKSDFPFPCHCLLRKDTIYITAAFGFMAGLGLKTVIYKDSFATAFFSEADGAEVFKPKGPGVSYTDRISVSAQEQTLTLFTKPPFAANETITGLFKGRFKPFYERDLGRVLIRSYKATLFFTCRLRSWMN